MKRGFIFSIDAFLAILLFVFVIILIYSFSISFFSLNQQYFFSEDILTTLSETKLNELDLSYYPQISNLISQGKINNTDVKIVEQIIFFQLNDDPADPQNKDNTLELIDDLIVNVKNQNINIGVFSGALNIYSTNPSINPDDINNLIARTRIEVGNR